MKIAARRFAVLGLFPFGAAIPPVQAQPAGKPQITSGTVTPNPATLGGEVTLVLDFQRTVTPSACDLVLNWGDGQQGNASSGELQHVKYMHPFRTLGRHTIRASGVGANACLGSVQLDVVVQAPPPPRDVAPPAVANAALAAAATARGAPTAVIKGTIGVNVDSLASFDGSGSTSVPPGRALAYQWNFGDGTTATGATATHRYHVVNVYSVTLVVTDGAARSAPASMQIRVAPPPQPGAPKHP